MKRFHVHLWVQDLSASIAFYSKLFAAEPARTETDYAKGMLSDPPVNFDVSTAAEPGVDHRGLQAETPEELTELKSHAVEADVVVALLDEGTTTCCYSGSEKHWVTDPQGIAWEQFQTLDSIPTFRKSQPVGRAVCCTPRTPTRKLVNIAVEAQGSCC